MKCVALMSAPLAVVVLLAGCGGPPAQTPVPADPSSPTATATPTPTPPVPTSAACTRDSLSTTYTPTDNSAGHAHGVITFLNISDSTCSLDGYPTVVFDHYEVAGQLGAVSNNDMTTVPVLVELAPGAAATAALTIAQAGFVDGCTLVTTNALLIAPPLTHPFDWSTDAQNAPALGLQACDNDDISLLTVGAVAQ